MVSATRKWVGKLAIDREPGIPVLCVFVRYIVSGMIKLVFFVRGPARG